MQYYNPYNEVDLQAPFVFNFSGEPWQSQRVVRRVLRKITSTRPTASRQRRLRRNVLLGGPQHDGIYSVDPASLAYELVGPTFPKVVIHLQQPYMGKTFIIESTGAAPNAPYIQSVQLNGQPHQQNFIHSIRLPTAAACISRLAPNRIAHGVRLQAMPRHP